MMPKTISQIIEHPEFIEIAAGDDIRGGPVWDQHRAKVTPLLEKMERPALAINMTGTQSINSMGVGSLLQLYKAVVAVGGVFGLVAVPQMIQGVLDMVGLRGKLAFHSTVDRFKIDALGLEPPPPKPKEEPKPPAAAEVNPASEGPPAEPK